MSLADEIIETLPDGHLVYWEAWGTDSFGKYRAMFSNVIGPQTISRNGGPWEWYAERYHEEVKRTLDHYENVESVDEIRITLYEPTKEKTYATQDN